MLSAMPITMWIWVDPRTRSTPISASAPNSAACSDSALLLHKDGGYFQPALVPASSNAFRQAAADTPEHVP